MINDAGERAGAHFLLLPGGDLRMGVKGRIRTGAALRAAMDEGESGRRTRPRGIFSSNGGTTTT